MHVPIERHSLSFNRKTRELCAFCSSWIILVNPLYLQMLMIFIPFQDCNSEQKAAVVLGYTEVSWDNLSGKEPQPTSFETYWAALTEQEKEAAVVLGYNSNIWDNESGSEPQPASANKHWSKLTVCSEYRYRFHVYPCMSGGSSDSSISASVIVSRQQLPC